MDDEELCKPSNGARLITSHGVRVMQLSQIAKDERVYCVTQGKGVVLMIWVL